ncbi:MAG: hypothetical protein LBJ12_02665 [Oscillospiraceae bacterium]|jgi:hypothetical protein|nr:hypothetical protein [Oscillospiraceae bacterium]
MGSLVRSLPDPFYYAFAFIVMVISVYGVYQGIKQRKYVHVPPFVLMGLLGGMLGVVRFLENTNSPFHDVFVNIMIVITVLFAIVTWICANIAAKNGTIPQERLQSLRIANILLSVGLLIFLIIGICIAVEKL